MHGIRSWLVVSGLTLAATFTASCVDGPDDGSETGVSQDVTTGIDLIESVVGNPPAAVTLGDSITASDTVTNQGTVSAPATVTRYYLSTDQTKSSGDTKLTGGRNVGVIAPSGNDAGSTSVTVPSMAAGTYYLLACADGDGTVVEDNESNNCKASSTTTVVSGPDLVESAVSDPPGAVQSGMPFSINDTVQNIGTTMAGASTTHYYVSLDGVHVAPGTVSIGVRAIGALSAGGSSAGSGTLAVPGGTPQGTYHVLACADKGLTVAETNENNNCLASTNTMVVTAPDLTESDVTFVPATLDAASGTLSVTETTSNMSATAAGDSDTRFYLSSDGTTEIGGIRNCVNGGLTPGRDIPSLAGGANSTGTTSFSLCFHEKSSNTLKQVPPGTYYMMACADDTGLVAEISETNNCATSSATFVVSLCGDGTIEGGETCDDGNTVSGDGCSSTCQLEAAPDLIESAVSNPPASAVSGGSFSVTDTAMNISSGGDTIPSTTKYYLSTDRIKSGGDTLLTGSRAVPALNAGTTSTGTVTVTLSSAPSGALYLIACADANNVVTESDETNNCIASTTQVTIGGPDLTETTISNPPAALLDGATLSITDNVLNSGLFASVASTTDFYVSLDGVHVAPGTVVIGTRSVPALAAGGSSSAPANLTITPGTPQGTYRIMACADGNHMIAETNENNNCIASSTTVVVTGPDLTESAVSVAPTTIAAGGAVTMTDTVTNSTMTSAGASTTRFYASTDTVRSTGDLLLRNCTTGLDIKRAIPALGSAGTSTGSTPAQVCYITGGMVHPIPAGTYFILACADDGGAVPESNEANNCTASSAALRITP